MPEMNELDNSGEVSTVARPKRSSTTRDRAFWSQFSTKNAPKEERWRIYWRKPYGKVANHGSRTAKMTGTHEIFLSRTSKGSNSRCRAPFWTSDGGNLFRIVQFVHFWQLKYGYGIVFFFTLTLYRDRFKIHFCTSFPGSSSYAPDPIFAVNKQVGPVSWSDLL